jgi:hypothetical protein
MQDPFDFDNDITKGTYNMKTVISAFSHAYDCLATVIYEHSELQNKYPDVKVRSILANIISIEPSVIHERKKLETDFKNMSSFVPLDSPNFKNGLVPNPFMPLDSPKKRKRSSDNGSSSDEHKEKKTKALYVVIDQHPEKNAFSETASQSEQSVTSTRSQPNNKKKKKQKNKKKRKNSNK